MKGLTLTQKEQGRLQTLNQVLEGWMGAREASYLLGLSERHTWRILASYRKEGAAALAHGNRAGDRRSHSRSGILLGPLLYITTYNGYNHVSLHTKHNLFGADVMVFNVTQQWTTSSRSNIRSGKNINQFTV